VDTRDSGKLVCRLLGVAALVVLLVGALAGMSDRYFAAPSDSRSHRGDDRTILFRMLPESQYNFPCDAPLRSLPRFGSVPSPGPTKAGRARSTSGSMSKSTFPQQCVREYRAGWIRP
jgi:hypothetical protein